MAITRITASSITGLVIPNTSINNASLDSVTALPSGIPTGKVGQITQGTLGSRVTSTSTSASATGLITSITPSSTNSKIYLMVNLGGMRMSANTYMSLWLYRQINSGGYSELRKLENGMGFINGSSIQTWGKAQNYLDTNHNTTNQIDYQIYFAYNGSGTNVNINVDEQEWSTITAMEILA
jgi:hypothetical protein